MRDENSVLLELTPFQRDIRAYESNHEVTSYLSCIKMFPVPLNNFVYFRLFHKKPEFMNNFNTLFKGKSIEAIKGSPELAAQAQSFKGMLNIWLENLDDPGCLTIQTLRFAKLHKARGVTADQIQVRALFYFDRSGRTKCVFKLMRTAKALIRLSLTISLNNAENNSRGQCF